MAKVSSSYEVLYILNPNLGEEETTALVTRFKELAEGHGAVSEVDEWGKRRLAYPINDLEEGYYVLMTFTADPAFPLGRHKPHPLSVYLFFGQMSSES